MKARAAGLGWCVFAKHPAHRHECLARQTLDGFEADLCAKSHTSRTTSQRLPDLESDALRAAAPHSARTAWEHQGYYLGRRFGAHTLSAPSVCFDLFLANCRSGEHLEEPLSRGRLDRSP
jgi:hypothetical protein